jgi:hypothetical protein
MDPHIIRDNFLQFTFSSGATLLFAAHMALMRLGYLDREKSPGLQQLRNAFTSTAGKGQTILLYIGG